MLHCWCQDPPIQFHFNVAIVLWRRSDNITLSTNVDGTQYSGYGLLRSLICFAPHTLVIQCQFKSKKVLSLGILNNILIFYLSTTYSLFFPFLNSSLINHLITLNAYLLSITQPYLYYRGCWHRFLPGLILFKLIMIFKFLLDIFISFN